MGLSIYVEGYQKNEDCIAGEIKSLDWYEVDYNNIQPFKILNTEMIIHDGIVSIDDVQFNQLADFGIYYQSEISWYKNMPSGMNGQSQRMDDDGNHFMLMYGTEKIIPVVENLIQFAKSAFQDGVLKKDESAVLTLFVEVLQKIGEQNGLVCLTFGD